MAAQESLERKLAQVGHAPPGPPEDNRKREIMARLFGDTSAPARIGRFIDLGLLGHGAMGTVRRAYDEQVAREVAIKLVRNRSSRKRHDRLLREAQALGQLSHPNVVQVFEAGEINGEVFIAMELIDGVSLDVWQRDRRPWRDCLEVYLQAGRGLGAAHAKGLVHRDFKPANCIRDAEGRVRVLDFGLVRALEVPSLPTGRPAALARSISPGSVGTTAASAGSSSAASGSGSKNSMLRVRLTDNNAVVGTIAYMAPEQFVGGEVDARSDQFGFCVALFEAIYGEPPFGVDPRPALLKMANGQAIAPVKPATPKVPSALRRALERGLAANPDARWPSMDALLDALEALPRTVTLRRTSALVVAGALFGGVGGSAYLEWKDTSCSPDTLRESVLGEDDRNAVEEAMLRTKVPYAREASKTVDRILDARASTWASESSAVCHDVGPGSAPRTAKGLCLQVQGTTFRNVVERLKSPSPKTMEHAVELVDMVLPHDLCTGAMLEAMEGASPQNIERIEDVFDTLGKARFAEADGDYEEALALAADAVANAEHLNEPLWSDALLIQGQLLMNEGDFDAARVQLEKASELAVRNEQSDRTLRINAVLGHLLGKELGRTDAAIERMKLIEPRSKLPDVPRHSRALLFTELGNVLTLRGDFAKAVEYFRAALEALDHENGDDNLGSVEALDGLATALRANREPEQALELRQRALELQENLKGPRHPDALVARGRLEANMAAVEYDRGQYTQAKKRLEGAISMLEGVLGHSHPKLASPHNSLGAVLQALEDREGAKREYGTAIGIWQDAYDLPPVNAGIATQNLGTVLKDLGDESGALERWHAAIAIFDRNERTRTNVEETGRALKNIAAVLRDQEDLVGAKQYYERGLTLLRDYNLEQTQVMASLLNGRARVARKEGDLRKAIDLHLRALQIYESLPDERLSVAHTKRHLAGALKDQEEWARAKKEIDESIELYEELGDQDWLEKARELRAELEPHL